MSDDEPPSFRRELQRLKRRGCSVLLTGRVPDDVVEVTSVKLLGNSNAGRVRVFGLVDRDVAAARRRLVRAGPTLGPAYVVSVAGGPRSTAGTRRRGPSDIRVRVVEDDPATFASALCDVVDDAVERQGSVGPGTLRLCLDSLRPLLDGHDPASVEAFITAVNDKIVDEQGMGHYVLPAHAAAEPVREIESLFDVTVEHRVHEGIAEHRWRLLDSGVETAWAGL